jgi:hypothetical protein
MRCTARKLTLSVHALLSKPPLPAPYRWTADTSWSGHLKHRKPVGGKKNDAGPQNVFLWTIAITNDGSQTLAVASGKDDANGLCHALKIAWLNENMNPAFVSLH